LKVLLSWLREFAPFEGDPVALGEVMSDLGMAVEAIEYPGRGLDGVVVARVLALRPHPDAERIQLVDVDAGDGEALQICCGAFNMAVGDLVPLATVGATLPDGRRIERRRLRGEWSNGMLCSAAELGLGEDHAGILVLPAGPEPGTDLRAALGIEADVLYDLEINPNRPDAMSVAGVARDLAARLGLPFAIPEPRVEEAPGDTASRASVEILAPDLCGRFHVRVLDGIRVRTSPAWLANRLTLLGMRPINSVVDVSNYVMLELGQPNHTYDLDRLPGGALRVRWARPGERIVTLDDVERVLDAGDGVIADGHDQPVGIAGVMGGASTEISSSTTSVLLEMAWWQPLAIARSAKRLGLRSEASARFERGTDPEIVELAARRFAQLLAPSGARLVAGAVDARGELPPPAVVRTRTSRVNGLLGTGLTTAEIAALLEPIGFGCVAVEPEVLEVRVPSFRPDTRTETDVIEEVARHHGYGNIPRSVPSTPQIGTLTERQRTRRLLRQVMVGLGVDEAMPLPFLAPGELERVGVDADAVTVTNPLAAEESVLRTSLRPGLLQAVRYNESHRNDGVRLFEIGTVFAPPVEGAALPSEREQLVAVAAGAEAGEAVQWWRVLAEALALRDPTIVGQPVGGLHPGRAGRLLVAGREVGVVGEISPDVAEAVGLRERVAVLELDLDALVAAPRHERRYRLVSRYPSSDVDLAFEVDEAVPAAEVERVIAQAGGPLVVSVRLFDVFRGPSVTPGRRSLAFSLRLQAPDRTLTDEEIAEVRQRVIDAVEAHLPAGLRA